MMQTDRRSVLALLAGAASGLATSTHAAAAAWPTRALKMVVPFPPGGGTDLAGRIVAERLAAVLGQPVVIENKPGASTTIGTMQVVDAAPDGYTLLFSGSTSFTVNPAVRPRLSYDPFRQLTPIAMLARAPVVLLTPANGPYKTLEDLLADAAKRPGQVNYATFGPGSAPHLATELLASVRGVRLTAVPYKGSAESTTALVRARPPAVGLARSHGGPRRAPAHGAAVAGAGAAGPGRAARRDGPRGGALPRHRGARRHPARLSAHARTSCSAAMSRATVSTSCGVRPACSRSASSRSSIARHAAPKAGMPKVPAEPASRCSTR